MVEYTFAPGWLEIVILAGGGLLCLAVTVAVIALIVWAVTKRGEEQ
jgi:hypothetical protein